MMKPNSSPGIDGFTAGFYQNHWDTMKDSICNAVLDFLNGGVMPMEMNRTILVLIPKVKHPQSISQYRSISLCNVIYKLCSKVLANRLRQILEEVISEEQSAFVPGRQISDNVLIAYECIHYMKRKKGKKGACAIKLDMAKAYDRLEWDFIHTTLTTMGFPNNLVQTIMKCVSSVTFSILVNGQPSQSFKPNRGIRQGDPLSPYLFILCADVFLI
jgi:hypothetical protein